MATESSKGIVLRLSVTCVVVVIGVVSFGSAAAGPQYPDWYWPFHETWERQDLSVEAGEEKRTWIWGQRNDYVDMAEEYGGEDRAVRYYDKARMEWNPEEENPVWQVTTGLLATELITGQLQIGDEEFEQREPAEIPVAGDDDSAITPTYATMKSLMDKDPLPPFWKVIQTIDADGNIGTDERFAEYDVIYSGTSNIPTNHNIASVFELFIHSDGRVADYWWEEEDRWIFVSQPLFLNPFYAVGYPITEPYWTKAKVAGEEKDVLVQCFERRCLTYTPDNPQGWKVESANIGQHYYTWRYGESVPWAE